MSQRKIKVLRIIARLNIGGPAIHTILLKEGMNKDKFQSTLVVGSIGRDEGDMMYLAEKKGIKPLVIPELSRELNIIKDLISLWKIYRLIRKEKPDIVHTHTAKAGALGRMAAILAGTPIKVHTFHGHVLHSYFGKLQTKIFVLIEKILSCFTEKIIAVSKEIKEELISLGIGNPDKIVVINLGLELDNLLSISPDIKSELKIGTVGRLVSIKNQKMFLDAAKNILSNPDLLRSNLKFILVGDGELESELKAYAEQLKIGNNVAFTGWERNIEKIYSNLDIVALTSLNEGTPVSIIEAMAAAKAVVATDVGGVKNLLGDTRRKVTDNGVSFNITERGILVGSKDVEGFSSALRFLLQNPDIRLTMGELGREFIRERFSKTRLIQDVEDLYIDLEKEKL